MQSEFIKFQQKLQLGLISLRMTFMSNLHVHWEVLERKAAGLNSASIWTQYIALN